MGRAANFDRPLVPMLYDLDVRLTSRVVWGTSVTEQARFAARIIDAATGPVLEVPVGTGLITRKALRRSASSRRPLARSASSAPLLVAVDLSAAVLRRARRRLGRRAVYVRADVAHLPFRTGAFHGAHSGNGFHLFPDPEAAAAELARTTRPGSPVAITTWTDRGRRLARAYQRLLARLDVTGRPRSVDEHARLFTAAGLAEREATVGGTLLRWRGERA
jgi:ubiquinone/menaquinone biosynthesis C-methylase UbiE